MLDNEEMMNAARDWITGSAGSPTLDQILILMFFNHLSCDLDVLNARSHLECKQNACTEVQGAGQSQCQNPNIACDLQPTHDCEPGTPNSCGTDKTCTEAGGCVATNANCPKDFSFDRVAGRKSGNNLIVGAAGACIDGIRLAVFEKNNRNKEVFDSNWKKGNTYTWNVKDNNNADVAPGSYPVRLSVKNEQEGTQFRDVTVTISGGTGGEQPGKDNCPADFTYTGTQFDPALPVSEKVTIKALGKCIAKIRVEILSSSWFPPRTDTIFDSGIIDGDTAEWSLASSVNTGEYDIIVTVWSSDNKKKDTVGKIKVKRAPGCDPSVADPCAGYPGTTCNPNTRKCEKSDSEGCSIRTDPSEIDLEKGQTTTTVSVDVKKYSGAAPSYVDVDCGNDRVVHPIPCAKEPCTFTTTCSPTRYTVGTYTIKATINGVACSPGKVTVVSGSTKPPGTGEGKQGDSCESDSNCKGETNLRCGLVDGKKVCVKKGEIGSWCIRDENRCNSGNFCCSSDGRKIPAGTAGYCKKGECEVEGKDEGNRCYNKNECKAEFDCCQLKGGPTAKTCQKSDNCQSTSPAKKPEGNRCTVTSECESELDCCQLKGGPTAKTCQKSDNCQSTAPTPTTSQGKERGFSCSLDPDCKQEYVCCVPRGGVRKSCQYLDDCGDRLQDTMASLSATLACNDVCEKLFASNAAAITQYDRDKDGYISSSELTAVDNDYFQRRITRTEAAKTAVFSLAEFNYLEAGQSRATISLSQGWNMVSAPGAAIPLADLASVCSLGKGGKAFFYGEGGYIDVEPDGLLEPLKGYWVYANADCNAEVAAGEELASEQLHAGWNIVSSSKTWGEIKGDCERSGNLWTWNPSAAQYDKVYGYDTLDPTKGYWVKVKKACTIVS